MVKFVKMNNISLFMCMIALMGFSHSSDTNTNPVKCGDNYSVDGAEITSPNFPDEYPPDLLCDYLITAPEGSAVTVVVEMVETENSHDYLRVYNGTNNRTNLVITYSGNNSLSYRRLEGGRNIFLQFKSDHTHSYRGFKVHYYFRPEFNHSAQCGITYTEPSGVITSPQYPHHYPHRISCDYRITAPEGSAIVMETENLFTEQKFDSLKLYDGPTNSSKLLANLTGTLFGTTLMKGGNDIFMRFASDGSVNYPGFKLNYHFTNTTEHSTTNSDDQTINDTCGAHFTANRGVITSPNYPDSYPANLTCEYRISASSDKIVIIEIEDFDTEDSDDYIMTFDGPNNSSQMTAVLSNELYGIRRIRSTNEALIRFVTNQRDSGHRGFKLNYHFEPRESVTCGGTYTKLNDVIVSPGYPGNYPKNSFCVYRITAPEDNAIIIEVEVMRHEINHDFLMIYNGLNSSAPLLAARSSLFYSKRTIQGGNNVLMLFTSDDTYEYSGFKLNYRIIPIDQLNTTTYIPRKFGCNANYTDVSGILTSPKYPSYYPQSLWCEYRISAPEGNGVSIQLEDFATEREHDWLRIYNGPDNSSKIIANYTGFYSIYQLARLPRLLAGSEVLLQFKSDGSVNDRGFKLNYQFRTLMPIQCGANFSEIIGVITSPNYPEEYSEDMFCEYLITVPDKRRIFIEVRDFATEQTYDWLKIFDGPANDSTLLANYSGQVFSYTKEIDAGNRVLIQFNSDGDITGKGFKLTYYSYYTALFNLTGDHGVITSPNYPNHYPGYSELTWNINCSEENIIILSVEDFETEYFQDRLDIMDSGELLARLTGEVNSSVIISKTNNISLKFTSDMNTEAKGFKISYRTKSTDVNATIISPNKITKIVNSKIASSSFVGMDYNCIRSGDQIDLSAMSELSASGVIPSSFNTCKTLYSCYIKQLNLAYVLDSNEKAILVNDIRSNKNYLVKNVQDNSGDLLINVDTFKLIWSVIGSEPAIFDMNLDGSDEHKLYSNNKQASHLTIDYQAHLYYFIDMSDYSLYSIDYQGQNEKFRLKSFPLFRSTISLGIVNNDMYLARPHAIYRLVEFNKNQPYGHGQNAEILFASYDYQMTKHTPDAIETRRTTRFMNISQFDQVIFVQDYHETTINISCGQLDCSGLCIPHMKGKASCLRHSYLPRLHQASLTTSIDQVSERNNTGVIVMSSINFVLLLVLAIALTVVTIICYRKLQGTGQLTNLGAHNSSIEMSNYDITESSVNGSTISLTR